MTEHPSWRAYADGCRCQDCRDAWRSYNASRNRDIAYGRITVDHYVDVAPALDHIARLQAAGMDRAIVARAAQISAHTMSRLHRAPRARTSTVQRILAVRFDLSLAPDGALVPALGTRRRLQALMAAGWPATRLADHAGCTASNLRMAASSTRELTLAGFARRVAALYDELWDQKPVHPNRNAATQSELARQRALARGWQPPIAWDDETIDDPNAEPWVDVAVGAHVAGQGAANVDSLTDLAGWGFTLGEAADRLGLTRDAVDRAVRRLPEPHCSELRRRFTRNGIAKGEAA